MRSQALSYLACPCCGGTLVADADRAEADGHIMIGMLVSACGARFPIHNGVPRLAGRGRTPRQERRRDVSPRPEALPFADPRILAVYARAREPRLLEELAPLRPHDIAGRAVLEVGCGRGAHTALLAGYGARDVVAVDAPTSGAAPLEGTFAATRHLPNVHVVQGDPDRLPVGRVFDIGVAMGALSHLPDPALGFRWLCDCIAAGGRIALWVHSHESRARIAPYVEPLRRAMAARISDPLLAWASWPPTALLSVAARACRDLPLVRHLPRGAELRALGHLPARAVHQLLVTQARRPPARYLRRSELERWFRAPGLEGVRISPHGHGAWRATAVVRGHAQAPGRARPQPHGARHAGGLPRPHQP